MSVRHPMKKFIVIAISTFLFGCTHLYKMYEYEGLELQSKFGEIGVSVSGSWKEISKDPDVTEKTGPYSVRIALHTSEQAGENIEIRVTDIGPSKTPVRFYKANEVGQTKATFAYQKESTTSYYSVLVSNIESDHEVIFIKFEVHYKGGVEKFDVELKPKFWKEHRNNFFDGIMSV